MILVLLLFVVVGIVFLSSSYALFKKQIKGADVTLKVGELSYNLESEKLENGQITISPNMSEVLDIKLASLNSIDSRYELYYKIVSPENLENEFEGGYLPQSTIFPNGVIEKEGTQDIQVIFNNTGPQEITVEIGVRIGLIHNEIVLEETELPFKELKFQKFYVFDYTGTEQEFVVPRTGIYKVELWGSSGAMFRNNVGGKGSYVSGILTLIENEKIYVYVGEEGVSKGTNVPYGEKGFNGGGGGNHACYTYYQQHGQTGGGYNYYGGGSTDLRLNGGNWNDSIGLRSRIMVAAGGGSANSSGVGKAGGGLEGFSAGGTKGTQTSAGSINGGFGFGGHPAFDGSNCNNNVQVGAGSGYYGGGGSSKVGNNTGETIGASGSSFISGHAGCIAIKSEEDQTPKVTTYTNIEDSYHYSGKVFTDTVMIDGQGYNWTTVKGEQTGMPSHDLTFTMTGNTGNGYARITYIGE